MPALERHLTKALKSREERAIKRRLPDPVPTEDRTPSTDQISPRAPLDFSSNDYLSLSTSADLRASFIRECQRAPLVLGSGGSRLLSNPPAHAALEARLGTFFNTAAGADGSLLFNSGYDANVGFFSCVPQPGDCVVVDEHIHASVHDGVRASRVKDSFITFSHNDLQALEEKLDSLLQQKEKLRTGEASMFVAVESLYSMDGTFAPLKQVVDLLGHMFPAGNAYLIVDEAHATGVYGPQGRGMLAAYGLERHPCVLARLHTFGKALASTGAVLLTTPLVRSYLVNYARPLIYTTALSHPNIIATGCAFDLLEDGTAEALSVRLLDLSQYMIDLLRQRLRNVPMNVLSLPPHLSSAPHSSPGGPTPISSGMAVYASNPPPPIIPLMTPHPRPLATFLLTRCNIVARPITWPTVPRGAGRVRICLRSGHTRMDVERLVEGCVAWASSFQTSKQDAAYDAALSMHSHHDTNHTVAVAVRDHTRSAKL
ncbi:PLP-dependent transferase [Punctularia strigosozonata HHB-11173 SS5]|uniref:PLP-dependent transferase n=1 Tax=Punctularia strigosozonata (strain HHB-11173) TaxID=741275 RepID=R7S2I7_PUNST|nr:PLP-dependent transferase [Punctularia strigosozonata HHB-11173 SS5]EIN03997.1 PLP-dependent transferase [Punctularia strigosozonata HHB-11173 SS5]